MHRIGYVSDAMGRGVQTSLCTTPIVYPPTVLNCDQST